MTPETQTIGTEAIHLASLIATIIIVWLLTRDGR
jgi:hypothetical protein